jgi:hypothetical protein
MKARSLAESKAPLERTPEHTSTPNGATFAMAAPTFAG